MKNNVPKLKGLKNVYITARKSESEIWVWGKITPRIFMLLPINQAPFSVLSLPGQPSQLDGHFILANTTCCYPMANYI